MILSKINKFRRLFRAPTDTRYLCVSGINLSNASVLEIGPLNRPIVPRNGARLVRYMDHLSTEGLREKYKFEASVDTSQIVDVDFVATDGRIVSNVGDNRFDVIVAAHVIEHVPDLIGWLLEAESVLSPEGIVALIIPDKRFTFDVCRRLSARREIEAAHTDQRHRPGIAAVIDHFSNVVHADKDLLWVDPKQAIEFRPIHSSQDIVRAIQAWNAGNYVDCHAWVFTPAHFIEAMSWAINKFSIHLKITRFTRTKFGNLEFYVQLKSTRSK